MKIVQLILSALGIIAIIPSFLLLPALFITAIIGIINKDYSYLKKYLKIWGYSLLGLACVLILYAVTSSVAAMISGGG